MSQFFWGSGTSAHQVEGNNHNDWTEWEHANSARLAREAASRHAKAHMQIPDYILQNYPNPLQEENYISGRACDHYNRYEEDFDLAKSLGHNAHRFSIEWSRIEPEEGKFDEKEIEHYRGVVRALRDRGMEPFVTLWHYTVPLWFHDQGGWLNKKSTFYFARYAKKMAEVFGDVNFWITLNETNVYAAHGFFNGAWPPEKKSLLAYLRANHHLSLAHRAAYVAIKSINPSSQVGIAHRFIFFTKFPASLKNSVWNHRFLNSIKNFQDFIGVNCYQSDRNTPEFSEFKNWSIDPEGFYMSLKDAAKYQKPLYVLENGIADARDEKRASFIREHVAAMRRAIADGVDIRGYFYWSLLDNFEWDSGFWPRFGLVEIDYKTMERKIRPSAWVYKEIIDDNLKI